MSVAATPAVTLLIAAAIGLINLWLGARVTQLRIRRKISVGDNGDALVTARVRAHANLTEYAPIVLILMALIELHGGNRMGLWALGALLVVGRLIHPFGMERPAPNPLRAGGMILTWAVLLALVVWGIAIGFAPRS